MPTVPMLRPIRERAMLTQGELAERSGVAQATISHLESGRPGRFVTIRRLASALDVSARYLIEGASATPRSAISSHAERLGLDGIAAGIRDER
jgi:transcriptional regulator with XRE-family HTH domain